MRWIKSNSTRGYLDLSRLFRLSILRNLFTLLLLAIGLIVVTLGGILLTLAAEIDLAVREPSIVAI